MRVFAVFPAFFIFYSAEFNQVNRSTAFVKDYNTRLFCYSKLNRRDSVIDLPMPLIPEPCFL